MRDQTWQKQKQLVEHDPLPVLSRAEVAEALCCYKVNLAYSENHYKLKRKITLIWVYLEKRMGG